MVPGSIAALRSAGLPLVKLFASVLRREADGRYWLVTPAERGRIKVEDVPFLAVALTRRRRRPRAAADLPHQSGRDCDGGTGPSAARRDGCERRAGALYSGTRRAGGAARAPGILRTGRARRRRSRSARRQPVRGVEQGQVLPARRARPGLEMLTGRTRQIAESAIDARPGDRALRAARATRTARLWRRRRPGRSRRSQASDARRPRSQSRVRRRPAPTCGRRRCWCR